MHKTLKPFLLGLMLCMVMMLAVLTGVLIGMELKWPFPFPGIFGALLAQVAIRIFRKYAQNKLYNK